MKLRSTHRRNQALTILEVLVIVAVLAVLGVVLLPVITPRIATAQRINCVNNLKQISRGFISWAADHNNQYPMSYSPNGELEWPATTNIAVYFQAMSNELSTPRILICPADLKHNFAATNFTTDFNNSRISYFLNLDARKTYPQELLSGDDNFAMNGTPVEPGMLLLSTNITISWTAARHVDKGNLSFADGSIAEESSASLRHSAGMSVEGTDIMTNRIVIP